VKINSDFRDLLQSLNAAGVRYLIVGGYAVMVYTEPRYTKDLDVWVEADDANADRLFAALTEFGAPMADYGPIDFTQPDTFFQIGIDPVRIDILTSVSGVDFAQAWERRVEVDFGGVAALVISRHDLIVAKRAAGRSQDRRDVRRLQGPE
jgi:predicted nucleotidyltransferase